MCEPTSAENTALCSTRYVAAQYVYAGSYSTAKQKKAGEEKWEWDRQTKPEPGIPPVLLPPFHVIKHPGTEFAHPEKVSELNIHDF